MKYLVEIKEIKDPRLKKIEPLAGLTNNSDIEADSQLSDNLSALLENLKISTFAIPFLSQLRITSEKLRRSLKLRIDFNKKQELRNQEISVENDTNMVTGEISVQNDDSEAFVPFDLSDTEEARKINPKVITCTGQ